MSTDEKTLELLSKLKIKNNHIRSFILGRRRSLGIKTQYIYALDLEFIQRNLDVPLEKANLDNIEKLIDLFEKLDHSPTTIKRRMAALSSFYVFFIKHGEISINPVKLADLPKRQTKRQPFLSYQEIKHLLAYQKNSFKTYHKTKKDTEAIQFRAILAMLSLAGLRLDELIKLSIEDIHIKNVLKEKVIVFGKLLCIIS